jgi:hypothetical protein
VQPPRRVPEENDARYRRVCSPPGRKRVLGDVFTVQVVETLDSPDALDLTKGEPPVPDAFAESFGAVSFPRCRLALQTTESLAARLPEVARFSPKGVLYAQADSLDDALAHVRRVVPQAEVLFAARATPDGRGEVALRLPSTKMLLVIYQDC